MDSASGTSGRRNVSSIASFSSDDESVAALRDADSGVVGGVAGGGAGSALSGR